MKNLFILTLFFLGVITNSYSQKIIEKEMDASSISVIEINSELVYNINIHSEKVSRLKVKMSVEGENSENILLSLKENGTNLKITPEYTPFFEVKNDKLAAHKVIAINLELIVPENLEFKINSSLSTVYASGKFISIEAILDSGNCLISNFSGDAYLRTKQGFIKVYANNSVSGEATSKKGTVINQLNNKGKYRIEAESFEGDVSLFLIK